MAKLVNLNLTLMFNNIMTINDGTMPIFGYNTCLEWVSQIFKAEEIDFDYI